MYIELHAASAFSFLEGASAPETLIERAAALDYPAVALLDRDGVYGAPRFHMAARKAGLRAIVGAELTVRAGGDPLDPANGSSVRKTMGVARPPFLWRLPVLVGTPEGYRHLCQLITCMKLRSPKGEGALTLEDFEGRTRGLVAFGGRALLSGMTYGVGGLLGRLVGLFGRTNVYVELQRHLLRDEEADNQALVALASAFHVPVVATNDVRFAAADERPLFDVLTCIRHKTTLARAGHRLARNAERTLKPAAVMTELFADLPQAVRATEELAERLTYTMSDLGYRFPEYPVPAGETSASFLRKLTDVGARERYRPFHDRARAQIARELQLIEKLDLAGYFLIVWDLVNFARERGILVQGRGSAANSAVCYSLGITAVDPVGMELLFERFLSEERGEWPDIDLDLPSGERREQVIQYVYERYGQLGAAMTANVISYRGRSAAREVGKTLGLDADRIDRLSKAMSRFEWRDPDDSLTRQLGESGEDPARSDMQLFADLWRRIQHLPRHLGQHSGGMVMCRGRLDDVVPLENASMPGRVVIQWDKDDCADMGIVKVDLLGLGMMAVLQDALAIVNTTVQASEAVAHRETEPGRAARPAGWTTQERFLDLARVPPDDPAVYRLLQHADTVGIFQVESRAQMATLPRLKPACFYDLVVEVALIRPGPIVGQMVHPYLRRRARREAVRYAHPSLEPILARTLGVPLFQEQLLRMAMTVAGFTGGEAEELRRAMGFKRSEERMRHIEAKLRTGMASNGITGETADDIVRSITSFALYGFPESHAASFALLVYASAYLKVHYPAAFYAALLNNQPMGFYHPATLVKDAQRRGVRFAPVDVQRSSWLCAVEPDGTIRLGLMYARGLRREIGEAIARAKERSAARPAAPVRSRRDASGSSSMDPPGLARSSAPSPPAPVGAGGHRCPKCGTDDASMLERVQTVTGDRWFCQTCAHDWPVASSGASAEPRSSDPSADDRSEPGVAASAGGDRAAPRGVRPRQRASSGSLTSIDPAGERASGARFGSIDQLIADTGIRRDELLTLAEIGALNAFGYDRRSALWQAERASRPVGELLKDVEAVADRPAEHDAGAWGGAENSVSAWLSAYERGDAANLPAEGPAARAGDGEAPDGGRAMDGRTSPLDPMSIEERVVADYEGTGLTIGPHPMALRRGELALRGVLRATDLPHRRHGRRVRVAGAVITRQRPGTAKGFVFLTLEDETGLANIIVQPDVFDRQRPAIVGEPFIVVEGVLQVQDGVTSIKAENVLPLSRAMPSIESHDFR
ncbi:MAG: error-prone DNA polymerase [Vicinamibacterales bacterium]